MIELQNISLSIGGKDLLQEVSATIGYRERVALIGNNGAGKTSLLRAIIGELPITNGSIVNHNITIGYVSQDSQDTTVGESFAHCEPWRVDHALEVVGLLNIPRVTHFSELSGGQATRIRLATILASEEPPSLLILDEPTNNLDSDGLAWLTHFINTYHGAVLFASHDRAFIDNVATKIWAISEHSIETFHGIYTDYQAHRNSILNTQIALHDRQKSERRRIERLLRKAKEQASVHRGGRASDNDKMAHNFKNAKAQINSGKQASALESRLDRNELVEKPFQDKIYIVHLNKPATHPKRLADIRGIAMNYNALPVIDNLSFEVLAGERIIVRGINGAGKSTLLGILAQRISPSIGEVAWSPSTRVGYFSQDVYGITLEKTVYENLIDYCIDESILHKQCRALGLSTTDIKRPAGKLSRGQQAKIGFAKLLLSEYDVLILDEPTNHLDTTTREVMEQALQQYSGAIVFASHDMYFAAKLNPSKIIPLTS